MSLYRQVPEGWQPRLTYSHVLSNRAPSIKAETQEQPEQPTLTPGRQRALEAAQRLQARYAALGEASVDATLDPTPQPTLTAEERRTLHNYAGHFQLVDRDKD